MAVGVPGSPRSSQMNPYRQCGCHASEEEDLYQRLDDALSAAFSDPVWAWGVAWMVARDAGRFPDLVRSAAGLMLTIFPIPVGTDPP